MLYCVARRSTSDGGPLERAEWLKFVAMFFNKEDLANTLYEQLVANYAQYEQSAARAVEGVCVHVSMFYMRL